MKDFNLNLESKSEDHSSKLPTSHPPVEKSKIGILIANLGTPDATNYWAVRKYLSELFVEAVFLFSQKKRVKWQVGIQILKSLFSLSKVNQQFSES